MSRAQRPSRDLTKPESSGWFPRYAATLAQARCTERRNKKKTPQAHWPANSKDRPPPDPAPSPSGSAGSPAATLPAPATPRFGASASPLRIKQLPRTLVKSRVPTPERSNLPEPQQPTHPPRSNALRLAAHPLDPGQPPPPEPKVLHLEEAPNLFHFPVSGSSCSPPSA